ncbi:serine hydroxymethyltransferase [Candidatus Daviesbacteria bacterium]|nr:serine hydroxymethyltransferase [Candidatus Daviesbacteria bacterium]
MPSKIFDLIEAEKQRQKNGLEMIPSENYVSEDVLKALGSILTDKYSEGYPGRRYYAGNRLIDEIEIEAQKLANKIFGTIYANVQPYSGSPANFAVDLALAGPGGTVLGLDLPSGGHLTHGTKVSFSGVFFNAVNYHVDKDGRVDFTEAEKLAQEHKPKLIWVGGTAYVYRYEFKKFAKIAQSCGAFLAADISHVAGLIAGGSHPSPTPYVDVITTTTHKTLRGPRGAVILITPKGFKKDSEITKRIDQAVFPGLQGGPHNHQTAAIAVAFQEVLKPSFKKYASQVVKNSKILAQELMAGDIKLVGNGTENHLMLIDLTSLGYGLGYQAQVALETAGITVNKQSLPFSDEKGKNTSPFYPSGIRLGTPALTSRGMKEKEMIKIAGWIKQALGEVKGHDLPKEKTSRAEFIQSYKREALKNKNLLRIKKEVEEFAKKFPAPGF